jgi:hypothetical protein
MLSWRSTRFITIHQMDTAEALLRLSALVQPGGMLGIIGVGRRRSIADSPYDALMFFGYLLRILPKHPWDHGAPVNLPRESFAEVRSIVRAVLPMAKFRRRILGRYTVIWHKPI